MDKDIVSTSDMLLNETYQTKIQAIKSLTDLKFTIDAYGNVVWLEDGDKPSEAVIEKAVAAQQLKELKEDKLEMVKNMFRKFREEQAVMLSSTLGCEVDAREKDVINISNLIAVLDNSDKINFRCADNSFKEITKADLIALQKEIAQFGIQVYQKKWQIEAQINNAKTISALSKIKIDFTS